MTDAIVIGGGPNGLVAANLLADQGWEVLLLEANAQIGGAVRSAEDVADEFVHDTFSSFYPLAAVSPTIRALGLDEFGLEWSNAPAPVGNPMTDGGWAIVHNDPFDTADELDKLAPGDGESWLEMYDDWRRIEREMVGLLLDPFPPVRSGAALVRHLVGRRGMERIRLLASSVRSLGDRTFHGDAAKMLLATNAQHADISPESAGSGLMGWLLVMLGQQFGYPVPRGGAGQLTLALARRFVARGGVIRCGERVVGVEVHGGRAVGVRTADEFLGVRRAVLADVSAPALYGDLLPDAVVPSRVQRAMRGFEWDPGTVKVDWALDAPIPWRETPSKSPGTVHLAESVDSLTLSAAQLAAGRVPDNPFLLMGQMTTADPTRSPAGTESAWAYTHVPQEIRGNGPYTGDWTPAEAERFADHIQSKVEQAAPGFTSHITQRRVMSPRDLESRNANLVGGAVNGGTAALHQQLVFRPIPGLARAETPVKGLFLASASAHPGGGVHGACGSNAARAAVLHNRVRRR
ncbi:NAD(P)/FAD-dependent oxidoreductase [Kribbella sp. NPDC051770]|uniref:phytoene desaturase family protein n=1 Tax=Kribbella sp. NPDC051770 TaxID=3155413 RepID=UPI0034442E44